MFNKFFYLSVILVLFVVKSNEVPVIGILTTPCGENDNEKYHACQMNDGVEGYSFFPSSYVKWVESGGAKVIPIHAEISESNLYQLLPQLNGVQIKNTNTIFYFCSLFLLTQSFIFFLYFLLVVPYLLTIQHLIGVQLIQYLII